MSESADFDPGVWRGHDFKDARQHYDRHAGRSYAEAVSSGVTANDLVPKNLLAHCQRPLVISVDVTGSMDEWPATIFSKLPYLELEGQQYLGTDMEISFSAIGDATKRDKYPLQVRPFSKGVDLKTQLEALKNEHGGGGGGNESYELTALYYARKVSMPNALRPIHIIIGDEQPYDYVDRNQARQFAYEDLRQDISTDTIFKELQEKYSVYIVRKPYDYSLEREISKRWVGLLGEDHVAPLADPNRVVDVIFGILAKETGRINYFKGEIEGRQRADQVDTVYKSLRTIHAVRNANLPTGDQKPHTGRSIMLKPSGGDNSTPLM